MAFQLEPLKHARAAELTQFHQDQRVLLSHLVTAFRNAGCPEEATQVSALMKTVCGKSQGPISSDWAGPWKASNSTSTNPRTEIWRVLMVMHWKFYYAGEHGTLLRVFELALESETRFLEAHPGCSPTSLGYNYPYQLRIQLITLLSGLKCFDKAESLLGICKATDSYWELMLLLAAAENKIGQGILMLGTSELATDHLDSASYLLTQATHVLQSHPESIKNLAEKVTRLHTDKAIVSHLRAGGSRTTNQLWEEVELKARHSHTGGQFVAAISFLARSHLEQDDRRANLLGQQAMSVWESIEEPSKEQFYQPFVGTVWAATLRHWLEQDGRGDYAACIIPRWQPQLTSSSTALPLHTSLPDIPNSRITTFNSSTDEKRRHSNKIYVPEAGRGFVDHTVTRRMGRNFLLTMEVLSLVLGIVAGFVLLARYLGY